MKHSWLDNCIISNNFATCFASHMDNVGARYRSWLVFVLYTWIQAGLLNMFQIISFDSLHVLKDHHQHLLLSYNLNTFCMKFLLNLCGLSLIIKVFYIFLKTMWVIANAWCRGFWAVAYWPKSKEHWHFWPWINDVTLFFVCFLFVCLFSKCIMMNMFDIFELDLILIFFNV